MTEPGTGRPDPLRPDPLRPDPLRPDPLSKADFEALARFRFGIRRYLRVSEEIVRARGLTPQQYQLLLALKGFPGRQWATVQELAHLIQLRHHSVVELINRAQRQGLVQREPHPADARAVRVLLTSQGEQHLKQLDALHRDELRRVAPALALPFWEEPAIAGRSAHADAQCGEQHQDHGGDREDPVHDHGPARDVLLGQVHRD